MFNLAIAPPRSRLSYSWLFSKQLDWLFFYVPVILGLAFFWLNDSPLPRQSAFWAGVALMAADLSNLHWAPTWFSYLDRKNRRNFASTPGRKFVYFFATPVIVALTMAGMFCYPIGPAIIFFLLQIWTTQHLMQQNIGILLLYHDKNSGEAIVNRELEKQTIWSSTVFFCLMSGSQLNLLGLKDNPALPVLLAMALVWVLASCTLYVRELRRQVLGGASLNVPALGFWLISVLFMLPCGCFVGHDFNQAFVVPLMVHWFQYVGLNFILVRRKYAQSKQNIQDLPVKRPILLFAGACLTFLFLFMTISCVLQGKLGIQLPEWQRKLLSGFSLGLGFAHYFVDSFLWRFREKHQRETVLPYIVRQAVPSTAQ